MIPNAQIDKALDISQQLFKQHYIRNKHRHKYKMKRRTYHFAFIFRRKRIIAIGINRPYDYDSRTKYFGFRYNIPKYKEYSHAHAETDAVSKCWGKTIIDSNHTMIVVRLNSRGELYNSQPCPSCQKILDQIGIKHIWWSNNDQVFNNHANEKYEPQLLLNAQ